MHHMIIILSKLLYISHKGFLIMIMFLINEWTPSFDYKSFCKWLLDNNPIKMVPRTTTNTCSPWRASPQTMEIDWTLRCPLCLSSKTSLFILIQEWQSGGHAYHTKTGTNEASALFYLLGPLLSRNFGHSIQPEDPTLPGNVARFALAIGMERERQLGN